MQSENVSAKKSRFVLSRRNQKGQVAIFVALIFQVVFVFFALLINVGLLVHQKINLQQSTDLAAYYGAMKQAELLNTIAHVNFQIKQVWKLLTWRYRVLGTFGFIKGDSPPQQNFPFEFIANNTFTYNGESGTSSNKCTFGGEQLGVQDIPFFCVGHSGFAHWPQSESTCQLGCEGFTTARVINQIPLASSITTPFGGNVSGSVNSAVTAINQNIADNCNKLGPLGAVMLTRFLAAYINDSFPRIKTIETLARNLSAESADVLDIEGKPIQDASLLTLKNNLTEANLSGFNDAEFSTVNGLANDTCRFTDGRSGRQFLRKIDFKVINYFLHNCKSQTGADYRPEAVYDPNSPTGLSSAFNSVPQPLKDVILSLLLDDKALHTVGYEKNPHCVEYYAVRATSEPQIPFLPITKIKLSAVAVAKPFGGSIGPWYGKTWPQASDRSVFNDANQDSLMDETLPMRDLLGAADAGDITKSIRSQPNFSLFVGDKKGLRNSDYLAAYHSALAIRDFKRYDHSNSNNLNTTGKLRSDPAHPGGPWPDLSNWNNIDNASMSDFRQYDSLASGDDGVDAIRALEITAIAPNQFDITHYSIDPDYYHNYYVKLAKPGAGIEAMINKVGSGMQANWLRADLGAVAMDGSPDLLEGPGTKPFKTFSVKDQIVVKNRTLDATPTVTGPGTLGKSYREIFNNLVNLQSSLLTGWTFRNYNDYDNFPGGANWTVDPVNHNMSFGQCANDWNNSSSSPDPIQDDNFKSPMDVDSTKNPPAPGNCVTGGRTGYSVKIVTPNMVTDNSLLINQLPSQFLNF